MAGNFGITEELPDVDDDPRHRNMYVYMVHLLAFILNICKMRYAQVQDCETDI